jgi:hypothetical protein
MSVETSASSFESTRVRAQHNRNVSERKQRVTAFHINVISFFHLDVMNSEFDYLSKFIRKSSFNRYHISSDHLSAERTITGKSLLSSKKRNPVMSKSSDAITSIGDENYLLEVENEETYEQLRKKMKVSGEALHKKASESSFQEAFAEFIKDMPMPISSASAVESDDMKSVMSKASSLGSLASSDHRMKTAALTSDDLNDLFPPEVAVDDAFFWDVLLEMEKESSST